MIEKLKNIATTTTGLYKKPGPLGDAFYLHGKHFDKSGHLKEDAILSKDIRIDDKTERHLLKDRDILFVAKGDNNRACIYYEKYGKAFASSLFFVIRVNLDVLIPEYLRWYINTPITQSKLEKFSKGSHIPSISKKSLRELEVLLPPLKLQEQILKVEGIWKKEKEITLQVIKEKENYYQTLLVNLAKKNKHEI